MVSKHFCVGLCLICDDNAARSYDDCLVVSCCYWQRAYGDSPRGFFSSLIFWLLSCFLHESGWQESNIEKMLPMLKHLLTIPSGTVELTLDGSVCLLEGAQSASRGVAMCFFRQTRIKTLLMISHGDPGFTLSRTI